MSSEHDNAFSGFDEADIKQLGEVVNLYRESSRIVVHVPSWFGDKAEALLKKVPPEWQDKAGNATDRPRAARERLRRVLQPGRDRGRRRLLQ